MSNRIVFTLPPKGLLQATNESDPLRFYYLPVIGALYRQRIQSGLFLLDRSHYVSVLEFGYGSGLLLPTLGRISDKLSGVDVHTDTEGVTASLSKIDVQARLFRDDVCAVGFDENSFDLIVAFSVFEHIKDYPPVLTELHRILKPGGELLIGMPQVGGAMSLLFEAIGFKGIEQHHVTTPSEILSWVPRLFRIKRTRKYPLNVKYVPALYFNMLLAKRDRQQDAV